MGVFFSHWQTSTLNYFKMFRFVLAACLIALAYCQHTGGNNHHGGNHQAHPNTGHCTDSAMDCPSSDCQTGYVGVCTTNHECVCEMVVKRAAAMCTSNADCTNNACDAGHESTCAMHGHDHDHCKCTKQTCMSEADCTCGDKMAECKMHNGNGECHCHHKVKRAAAMCTSNADCANNTCHDASHVSTCAMHGHDHDHCHCTKQTCMSEADCMCGDKMAECKMHNGNGECHCHHKVKRAQTCSTVADCAGTTCEDNQTLTCMTHHNGGHCHCEHNA